MLEYYKDITIIMEISYFVYLQVAIVVASIRIGKLKIGVSLWR
jgi:hypothetical protein